MSDDPRMPGTGPAESVATGLRGWLLDGVQLLRVRLELFGLEARDHAADVLTALLCGLAAVLLLMIGLVFLAVLLTVLLWDSHRVLALAVFATLFLSFGGVALWVAVRRWPGAQTWFASSLRELKADAEQIHS
ncbi:MAG TPA: phage holin family protein [Macromonas sp.]|nr:phage holin family protein [Macromonas sp.]